jgi:hypothetical protein
MALPARGPFLRLWDPEKRFNKCGCKDYAGLAFEIFGNFFTDFREGFPFDPETE